jgi:hypothetical protein
MGLISPASDDAEVVDTMTKHRKVAGFTIAACVGVARCRLIIANRHRSGLEIGM